MYLILLFLIFFHLTLEKWTHLLDFFGRKGAATNLRAKEATDSNNLAHKIP